MRARHVANSHSTTTHLSLLLVTALQHWCALHPCNMRGPTTICQHTYTALCFVPFPSPPCVPRRSHVMDFHMDNNSAPSLRIATALSTLTRLDLLPQTPPRPAPILTALGHTQGVQDPFKLDWLQHNTALQHLAVPLIQTGQVRRLASPLHGSS
jgi:hypothetical protein